MFVVYEQQLGIDVNHLVDTCGEIGTSITITNGSLQRIDKNRVGCSMNPTIDSIMKSNRGNILVAWIPHWIQLNKFEYAEKLLLEKKNIKNITNNLDVKLITKAIDSYRETPVLLVGATYGPIYKLRSAGSLMIYIYST